MAREVATAYGLPMREPAIANGTNPSGSPGEPRVVALRAVEKADIDVVIEIPTSARVMRVPSPTSP
jgi:hypothetical protein